MIYVASPYSDPDPTVREYRYTQAFNFTCALIAEGYPAFSPIAYGHPISLANKSPSDAATWHSFNMEFLRHSSALYLLELPGVEESQGVRIELNMAKLLTIPVIRYDTLWRQAENPSDVTAPNWTSPCE